MESEKLKTNKAIRMNLKAQTVVCPHCGEDFDVKENGRYICPECENCVDVDDWFDTPHVMQPDGVTCGWATAKWLLSAFGLEVPSDRRLERELHVRKAQDGLSGAIVRGFNSLVRAIGSQWDWCGIGPDDISGTLPTALVATLWRRGLAPVFPGLGGLIDYSSYKDYMKDVFARHGRFAMFYVKPEYAHWIGIEKFKGKIRVMDPSDLGYTPFGQHEAIRSKRIVASCMIGFVRA